MGAAGAAIGAGAMLVGSLIGGNNDEPDQIPVNNYKPLTISDKVEPINFMKMIDEVSGDQFRFIRNTGGERYIELKNQYDRALSDYESWSGNVSKDKLQNLALELEKEKLKSKKGEISIEISNTKGRTPADAPISYNDVNTQLPEFQKLQPFEMKYATAVAVLNERLNSLSNTIEILETTNPEVITQNKQLIDNFKAANKRAMDRGFDIKRNGIANKLAKMGLTNSSTALGSMIALSKDRVDSEIMSNLQVSNFAQGLKRETIESMYKLGKQTIEQTVLALDKYKTESGNELTSRGQELQANQMLSIQAAEQIKLNLEKEKFKVQTELSRRELGLKYDAIADARKNMMTLVAQGDSNAIQAVSQDNTANFNKAQTQLQHNANQIESFKATKATESNPFAEALGTVGGTLVGSYVGGHAQALSENAYNSSIKK